MSGPDLGAEIARLVERHGRLVECAERLRVRREGLLDARQQVESADLELRGSPNEIGGARYNAIVDALSLLRGAVDKEIARVCEEYIDTLGSAGYRLAEAHHAPVPSPGAPDLPPAHASRAASTSPGAPGGSVGGAAGASPRSNGPGDEAYRAEFRSEMARILGTDHPAVRRGGGA